METIMIPVLSFLNSTPDIETTREETNKIPKQEHYHTLLDRTRRYPRNRFQFRDKKMIMVQITATP